MEVTKKNFKETLPLVEKSIQEADFLVIDTEFTGLINGPDVSIFDPPEQYYTTLLQRSTEFLLVQFGLSAFRWDEDNSHYMNDSYNFYVFPRGRPGPEKIFLCQSSSLDFLASQGFDFNKVIRDGISYMTEPIESRLRENLTERQKLYSNDKGIILLPEENKQHIEEICQRVRQFIDEKNSDEMEIDRCNAFVRRLLFQELGNRFKNEVFVETKVLDNKNRVLKVTRVTSETEVQDRDLLKKEKEWEEFEDAVGFSKVARMISQSEKLVIGHNMLLDVLHTLNHFFQPLPYDYEAFKEFTHCMFPRLLDTKYMSSLPPFKDKVNSSVLLHLLATLAEPPFKMPKTDSLTGRGYTQTDDKHHEAGYDAYVTGLCFLAMHDHLASMRGENNARVTSNSAILKPFINKLFLAKTAHQDSPFINLVGKDPSPSRDHVFHMLFPKEWQRNDINQLFSPFGPIFVQFLDDTSALVALSRREQARDVLRILGSTKRVTLQPYAKYKHVLDKSRDGTMRRSPWELARTNSTPPTPRPKISSAVSSNTPIPTKSESTIVPEKELPLAPVTVARSDVPEKVERTSTAQAQRQRSLSASPSPPVARPPSRKRTSSGVFQVDEAEPPSKKPEVPRSSTEAAPKKPEAITNGRRKAAEKPEAAKEKELEKKVIERFDKSSDTKCVAAFKESDTWD